MNDSELVSKLVEQHFGVARAGESIAAAWQVVERMGDCLHLREHGEQGAWEAMFCGFPQSQSHADTAPLAICLAALRAVGVEVPDQ